MPVGGGSAGGKSSDVRAGGAFVELFGKDNLSKVLDRLKAKVAGLGTFIGKVGGASLVAGAGILAPLTGFLKAGVNNAVELNNLAAEFGIPIEQLHKFKYAADVAGVSLEKLAENPGRFKDLIDSAPAFDAQATKDAVAAQRAWNQAILATQAAMLPLVKFVVPVVEAVRNFVQENGHLIQLAALGGAALLGLGVAAKAAALALGIAAAAVGVLKVATLALLTPEGLLLAGIALLAVELLKGSQTVKDFGDAFAAMAETAKEAWGGIVAAMQKGDLQLAGQIAMKGLELAWAQLMVAMTKLWVEFKKTIVDGWWEISNAFANRFGVLADAWQSGDNAEVDRKLKERWEKLSPEAKKLFPLRNTNASTPSQRLDDLVAQEDKERQAFRQKQIDDARAEVDRLKGELNRLTTEAKEKPFQSPGMPTLPEIAQAVRGTFGGPLGQVLGGPDGIQKQQLDAMKRVERAIEEDTAEMKRFNERLLTQFLFR